MNTNRDFDRIAGAWLAEGPSELADRVLDAALDEVHLTHQRRLIRLPWRLPPMNTPLRLVAAIAIVAVVGYAGLTFLNPGPNPGSEPSPTPTVLPTLTPGPTASPEPTPIDTANWTTYTSDRYGFSIRYPADWDVEPANDDWSFPADINWLAPAQEAFIGGGVSSVGPDDGLRVSAYSVAVEPGSSVDTWFAAYCPIYDEYCTALEGADSATMDGHAGTLVEFAEDVQAFFLVNGRIYVVAAWRPEERDVLEAFISTMRLLPGGPVEASPSPS